LFLKVKTTDSLKDKNRKREIAKIGRKVEGESERGRRFRFLILPKLITGLLPPNLNIFANN